MVTYARWLAVLGGWAYQFILRLNHWFNEYRRRFCYPYGSLSACLKHKVKNAVQFISEFEEALAVEAMGQGVDGVVCGHIHKAEMRSIKGILYCNDGDWVESCTALVEKNNGMLEIVHWGQVKEQAPVALPKQPAAVCVREAAMVRESENAKHMPGP